TVGERSKTDVSVCYLTDKADMNIVNAVTDKLKNIPLNTIAGGEYLQSFLEDDDSVLFSQIYTTERPDVFVSKLYEGRVGIIVDGTPFALVLPCLFAENFVTMDDYTHKPYFSAFLRIIRFFAFIAGAVLPGLYVALCNFHPEMFRSALLLNIYSSEQTAAYPVFGECLIMYILYEIMREAGLR
ncbi:membrane protein yndD, partial [human gut metagenome]